MVKKIIKCTECWYEFLLENSKLKEKGMIICPYCKKRGNISDFEDTHQTDFGTGYTKSLGDLQDYLGDATKYKIKSFFKEDVKIIRAIYKKGKYTFTDSNGNDKSIKQVHDYIQSDVVLQRKFYNMWMSLYR